MGLGRNAILGLLRPIVKDVWGVQVRYHHATSGNVYTVIATLDGASGEVETSEGVTIPFHVGLFKIDRNDLPVMPQRLDRIEWIDDLNTGRIEWFQVLSDSSIDSVAPNNNNRDVWTINAKWIPAGDESTQTVHGADDGTVHGNQDGTGYASTGN